MSKRKSPDRAGLADAPGAAGGGWGGRINKIDITDLDSNDEYIIEGKSIPRDLVAMVYGAADEKARKCAAAELAIHHNDEFNAIRRRHFKKFLVLELQRIGVDFTK